MTSLPSARVLVAMERAPEEWVTVPVGKGAVAMLGLFETLAAQPRPSTSREIDGKALISFLLLNYFICIYFKLEDKIMAK